MTATRTIALLATASILSACAPASFAETDLPPSVTLLPSPTFYATPTLGAAATVQPTYSIVTPQYFTVAQLDEYSVTREPSGTDPWSTGVPGHTCPAVDLEITQAQAGFRVRQPTALPDDFQLTCAIFRAQTEAVYLYYTRSARSPGKITMGEFVGNYDSLDALGLSLQDVGSSALIYPVQVGNFTGEYANGDWLYYLSTTAITAEWSASGPLERLRWEQDGLHFEIRVDLNNVTHVLGPATLVAWAESVR